MTNAAFTVKPAENSKGQTEIRQFAPHETASCAEPIGTVTINYRSGDLDRFQPVPAAVAGKMVAKVHDSRTFSGTLMIEGADCIGVINMAEVESITFRQDRTEAQS